MSLDNIQLPHHIITGLYNKTLVLLEKNTRSPHKESEDDITFLGKNAKKILVIVAERECNFLADEDLDFLIKMLNACQISLADIALVNLSNNYIHYQKLIDQFSPESILLFGLAPANIELPTHFPNFQLQKYNSRNFVTAPALKTLASNTSEKKLFWTVLKTLFQLP